jgi:superfamily II RNA helicase
MVRICDYEYPSEREDIYKEYYTNYSYELHGFQKWTVESIVTGNHVLITAPTGSGKTFGGEFALQYFHSKGKKTIYTSPIKALSNEKFYAFTQKYPHIKIGLITGDIKTNPEADVLIMTTEILLNKLYQIKSTSKPINSSISFDMDIQTELGCVVFDEIHMINDESRGHVWEQSIMSLPKHIQIVGLSATLDNPEKFASWLENKGNLSCAVEKEVYLARKLNRAVPLIHYTFITANNGVNKHITDKATQQEIRAIINKPFVIQDANGIFNDAQYKATSKTLQLFEKNNIRVTRQHTLNMVTEYLVNNEMLPALCYVFSRKQLEKCAEELNTTLLEFDSKVPYTIDYECEKIIRKLPNYQEYLNLPEYINTVKLLRKGIGMHHAGLMPILREMTELLFAQGYIKLLFCTETMSVGINLPVKTTIFTDITKFNGNTMRLLYSHEYTQAAGRAGRLGLDTIGHVIHLNNLFRNVEQVNYKAMMNGKPQTLTSKFKISYNLLLNLLDIGDKNVVEFANRSMVKDDINSKVNGLKETLIKAETELNRLKGCMEHLSTPIDTIKQYKELEEIKPYTANKKRKEVEKQMQTILDNYKFIKDDTTTYLKFLEKEKEVNEVQKQCESASMYIENGAHNVLQLLEEEGFLKLEEDSEEYSLTIKGQIATQLKETHCLVFSQLIEDKKLDQLSSKHLVSLFSCFTNISVQEDFKCYSPNSDDDTICGLLKNIVAMFEEYQQKEINYKIQSGIDYNVHFDLLEYVDEWCDASSVEECKIVLQNLGQEKEIFLGEFVKALLKINNISCEMEKIAEMTGNIEFLSKLREIPKMTLKYVVTNQSLYV